MPNIVSPVHRTVNQSSPNSPQHTAASASPAAETANTISDTDARRRALRLYTPQADTQTATHIHVAILDLVLRTTYVSLDTDATMVKVGVDYASQCVIAHGEWLPNWHLLEGEINEWTDARHSEQVMRCLELDALRQLRTAIPRRCFPTEATTYSPSRIQPPVPRSRADRATIRRNPRGCLRPITHQPGRVF
jgi:hypothetical protein